MLKCIKTELYTITNLNCDFTHLYYLLPAEATANQAPYSRVKCLSGTIKCCPLLQIHTGHGETGAIHAIHTGEGGGVAVDLSNVTEATLNQDGQLILTGDDGQSYPVSVSGMITVPVSGGGGMYQTVMANIQHIQAGSDGTMQVITPLCHVPKVEPTSGEQDGVETITHQLVNIAGEPQMLQVLSLKDSAALSKAIVTSDNKDSPTITGD
ncbi:GTPase regulator Nrf1 [Homalodisca vitripennis]|nr:GTPase regulator Nrf1 [Homalodisca vitripennis]